MAVAVRMVKVVFEMFDLQKKKKEKERGGCGAEKTLGRGEEVTGGLVS